ncbi:MAG: metalloregulator ArsR/SmtB family transcription factor [Chloroflexi bacterium]|nr:metalloregulator ArsR/SmtB family transcription factor [Chloroflexota bacterium]
MDAGQSEDLLKLLKAVADENRLRMVSLLSERAYTVSELAGVFDLTEPTVSHHVSKLHAAGLLRLKMEGNQRFYSINEKRLSTFKFYVNAIEQRFTKLEKAKPDTTWIEALDWSESDKKILRDYTRDGKLVQMPVKDAKALVILRWLVTKFEQGKQYTEKQINTILGEAHEDYATLRRTLVDYGYMRRERGGSVYWLTPEDEKVEPKFH